MNFVTINDDYSMCRFLTEKNIEPCFVDHDDIKKAARDNQNKIRYQRELRKLYAQRRELRYLY